MQPRPEAWIKASPQEPKLAGRVAVISGGDSGIGRAVALAFASEGADVGVLYLNEHRDAKETVRAVKVTGRRAVALAGDIGDEKFCQRAIARMVKEFGRVDILVNNAAEQHPQDDLEKITAKQLERTFRSKIDRSLSRLKPEEAAVLVLIQERLRERNGPAQRRKSAQSRHPGNASVRRPRPRR